MQSRFPRWLIITLIAVAVAAVAAGLFFLFRFDKLSGFIVAGLLAVAIGIFAVVTVPPLYKLNKFQKYLKKNEAQLNMLPSLMQSGRVQEAVTRFEAVMKHAPENAYIYYMRAFFLNTAGKQPEAMSAATKALALAGKDPFLPMILQQAGGQMGQPATVKEFKEQLEELRDKLEPRLQQMRDRREKAATKRKKKSR